MIDAPLGVVLAEGLGAADGAAVAEAPIAFAYLIILCSISTMKPRIHIFYTLKASNVLSCVGLRANTIPFAQWLFQRFSRFKITRET
jgi:hypothetical protein